MIPNLYMGNGCFTKHPSKNCCGGFQDTLAFPKQRRICSMVLRWRRLIPRQQRPFCPFWSSNSRSLDEKQIYRPSVTTASSAAFISRYKTGWNFTLHQTDLVFLVHFPITHPKKNNHLAILCDLFGMVK